MSMPTFPKNDPPLTREVSLNEIISSIAVNANLKLEENAEEIL